MPTKRKRKTRNIMERDISENLHEYFLTGKQTKGDVQLFILARSPRLKIVWDTIKKDILTTWIKAHPCSRPYAFWLFRRERRQCLNFPDSWQPGMAIDAEGLPKYWQIDWKKPRVFESQAAFLQRYGLLTDAEKQHLEKNPELLEPDEIEYDR